MGDVTWEEPPDDVRAGHWMVSLTKTLQKNPGKWARVIDPNGKTAFESPYGTRLRDRGLEVRTRKIKDADRYEMWARWPEEE